MTSSKVKIKPVGGKDRDAIEVFPVDAKEAVAGGTHEYVGQDLGNAEWINPSNKGRKPVKSTKGKKESDDSDQEETDSDEEETQEVDIESMGSEEIDAFVEEQGIKIKGFDALGLVKKRKALTKYLEENSEEEI
jgi:hypothetical protein